MAYEHPEPDDPQELVGVVLPGEADSAREMAAAFAEEFAQMGLSRARILALFQAPFYRLAHAALAALGEEAVARIVDESLRVWGRRRYVVEDAPPAPGAAGAGGLS